MKKCIIIIIVGILLFGCKDDIERTPYEILNLQIEEIEEINTFFWGEVSLRKDTISCVFEDIFVTTEPLKFILLEAHHISYKNELIYITSSVNTFFPNDDYEFSKIKTKRYRIRFDLLGIVPSKINAKIHLNGTEHIL